MAIDLKEKGSLGCAYFSVVHQSLFLLNDLQLAELDILDALLIQVQPTTVLLPFQAPEPVLDHLTQIASSLENGLIDSSCPVFTLRTSSSADFNQESALETLTSLHIGFSSPPQALAQASGGIHDPAAENDEPHADSVMGAIRLGSYVHLDACLSIGCAGAALNDVIRRRNDKGVTDGTNRRLVDSIQMFSLSEALLVNAETLASLQILQSELHPNRPSNSGAGEKEGHSLFGLFHPLAGTPQGKTRLRQLFLRPVLNLELIGQRQKAITVFLRPENAITLGSISRILRKLTDLRKALSQLQRGVDTSSGRRAASKGTWWTLTKFAMNSLHLRDALLQLSPPDATEIQTRAITAISIRDMKFVGELIEQTIDFEELKDDSHIAVRWGLNEELDNLKRQFDGLTDLLEKISTDMAREVPGWAVKYIEGCTFMPQLGFLTIVPVDPVTEESQYEGQGLDEEPWEKHFTTGKAIYYKNRRMHELDDYYGDIYGNILDMQIDILHELSSRVMEHEEALVLASDVCGDLDCIVALAIGAEKYQWAAPEVTTSNIIHIRGGRHPLQQMVLPSFIPNDCDIVGGKGEKSENSETTPEGRSESRSHSPDAQQGASLLVLTGPNHSGKSVYLKQVALIVYLAHIGSFVPADKAIIGLTDQILTRISTRESATENESAFASDLRQVAFCLKSAKRRSLVLVDEFGKGTRADDGAGLMAALLRHFLSLGAESPRVLAATHFHEIFELDRTLEADPGISLAHMEVRLDLETKQKEDMITYMYNLVPGRSVSSFGGRCAALNGVDEAVVDRAEAIALLLARNEDLSTACAKLDVEDQIRLEQAEAVARRFLRVEAGDLPTVISSRDVGCVRATLQEVLGWMNRENNLG